MNVTELIEKLKAFDPSTRVVVPGYEIDVDDIRSIRTIHIRPNYRDTDEYWAGEHDVIRWGCTEDKSIERVVLIQGRHGDLP